jgi:hypothetical protein
VGNNSGRVHVLTAEPFTAPPPDPKKCLSAVTANWERSCSINASTGECFGCKLRLNPKEPAWLINKNPPRKDSGGNGEPFFGGYAGSARSGSPFEVSQRMTLGRSGFGRVSICFQLVQPGQRPRPLET